MAPRTRSKTGDAENEPSRTPTRSIKTSNLKIASQPGSSTRGETENKTSRAPLGSIPAPNDKSPLDSITDELGSLQLTSKDPKDALIAALQEENRSLRKENGSLRREPREERHQTPFHFPSELHDYILGLADTASLVMASRANKEFWELAQKHLYRHVDIKDVESLALLFRERGSVFPTNDGIVLCSLNKIRTLSVELSGQECDSDPFHPHLHLPPNIKPLSIDLLQVTSNPLPTGRSSSRIKQSPLFPHLLEVVNPSAVNFRTLPRFLDKNLSSLFTSLASRRWNRLRHLEITKSVDSVVSFGSTRTSLGTALTYEWQPIEIRADWEIFLLSMIVNNMPGLTGGTVLLVRSEEEKIRVELEVERAANKEPLREYGEIMRAMEVKVVGLTVT